MTDVEHFVIGDIEGADYVRYEGHRGDGHMSATVRCGHASPSMLVDSHHGFLAPQATELYAISTAAVLRIICATLR